MMPEGREGKPANMGQVRMRVPEPSNQSRLRAWTKFALGRVGLLGFARVGVRLSRLVRNGLRDSGWLLSAAKDVPVSASGAPIPWFPFPAIHFLQERLPLHARLFEYGSGHSTLWFAERVATVISVESDPRWASYVQMHSPGNVKIILATTEDSYIQAIAIAGGEVDLVVVDGLKGLRYQCGRAALDYLAPDGVLLWDNADWPDYQQAFSDYLAPRGFKQLIFRGFGPLGWREWSFAVLYREHNCLGI